MPDSKAAPIIPSREACAIRSAEFGNSADIIKKIKRHNDVHHQPEDPDSCNFIELPQPTFREVPVHVTRTQNRPFQAMPPPSTQPQASSSRHKDERRRHRKGLGGNGDGDGSESDSGGEGRRNGRHGPDGPLQRRKAVQSQPSPSSHDPPSLKKMIAASRPLSLSPEEEERVQNLKKLRQFEKTWEERMELRQLKLAESKHKRKSLLQGGPRGKRHYEDFAKVKQNQAVLNEYLDESLYSAIVDDRLSSQADTNEKQTQLTNMISQVESKVIKILIQQYDVCDLIEDEESQEDEEYREDEESREETILIPKTKSSSSTARLPHFFKRHLGRTVRQIYVESFPFGPLLDNQDHLVLAYLDIIINGITAQDIVGLPTLDLLTYSRSTSTKRNQLTPKYIEWLRSRVGAAAFDTSVARYRLRIAGKKPLEEFKEKMRAVHMDVSQEFCQRGSEVDLVLFKGGRPSTIQRVFPDDLACMGWRQGGKFGRD